MQPAAMPTTMEMTIWKNFITMPTTAIGICAYCFCENISSSAPYLRSMLLMAAIAATRLICDKKLVMPSVSIRVQRLACRRKSPFPGLTVFMRQRYHTASAAVTIWPNTVATAAPIMPHLHSKMKMGSKMMLSTAPASVEIMANRGSPSARMTGFIA